MRAGTFDPRELTIEIADPGFIVGISVVGAAIGAGSGVRADVSREVKSIEVTGNRTVTDDLYITNASPSCVVGLIFPNAVPRFVGKNLVVQYRGQTLFNGNVNVSSRSAEVDQTQRGGKKWTVALQSADLNLGSRKIDLTLFSDTPDMVTGILERVPGISTVNISASVLDRARTFRMPAGSAWGNDLTDQATFFDSISRTLSCIVEINSATPTVLTLRGYDDGITWIIGDQPGDDPSYSTVSIDQDATYATGIRLTALGSSAPSGTPDAYSASYYAPGLNRNDKDYQVAVPATSGAPEVTAVLNTLPVFSTLPESVRTVTIPFSEELDLSGIPVRIEVWLEGQLFEAAIVGVKHTLKPSDPQTGPSSWSITLDLGPLYLITRGAPVAPVTMLGYAGSHVVWTDTPGSVITHVDYRTDGRWSQYPYESGGVSTDVALGVQTFDMSALPSGTYYVTVWAIVTGVKYSEARTILVTK